MTVELSVIIPAYNPPATIQALLRSLAHQRTPFAYDVLVVDDASSPERSAELKRAVAELGGDNVFLHRLEANCGPARARNHAAARARGGTLLFIDADCFLYDDTYLARAREVALEKKDCIVGGTVFGVGKGYVAFCDHYCHWITNPPGYSGLAPEPHIVSTSMIMSRAVWERVGPFDETLRSGEDVDLCFRATGQGIPIWVADELRIGHYDRQRLRDYFANYFYCGSYRHDFYGRYDPRRRLVTGGPRWLRTLLIPAVTAALSLRYLKGFWPRDKRIVLALPGIVVACLAMALGLAAGRRRPPLPAADPRHALSEARTRR